MAKTDIYERSRLAINPSSLSVEERDALDKVSLVLDIELSTMDGIALTTKRSAGNELVVEFVGSDEIMISYPDIRAFARGLSHLRDVLERGVAVREQIHFEDLGFMVDLSRNAALTVDSIKLLLNYLAVMGYNNLFLYIEDVYEVADYPYFSYQRGTYTQDDLREIDDYADSLGIEAIPCMQTLAHLKNTLRWPHSRGMKDTEDVLLVGADKTYEFIAAMLKSLSESLRTRRIHIGMDEAWRLGRGVYQDINGPEEGYKIFEKHLKRVIELCDAENYEPMIWSDMYFRFASKHHSYYDMESPLTEEMKAAVPQGVDLVYWDYYNTKAEVVNEMLSRHNEVNDNAWFAGGIWNWNGIKTNHGVMFRTTEVAIDAAKKQNIKHVMTTAWGDNGAETSVFEALLGAQYLAEISWNDKLITRSETVRRYSISTGSDGEAYYNMRFFDEVPGVEKDNLTMLNPSKYILWSDVLNGLFDAHINPMASELITHYSALADYYDIKANNTSDQNRLFFLQSAQLGDVLSRKVKLTAELRSAYLLGERVKLQHIVDFDLPELIAAMTDLQAFTLSIWYLYNKPQGSEVIDIRFGSTITRLKTALDRVDGYLKGVYDLLPELEQDRLSYDGRSVEELAERPHIRLNTWNNIVSANPV